MLSIRTVSCAVVLCAAFTWGPAEVRAGEPIREAFGLKIGAVFHPSDDPEGYVVLGGVKAYHFIPEAPSRLFTVYLAQITPITHLVHTVIAIGPVPDIGTCRGYRADLMPGLRARYGDSFTFEPPVGPSYESDYEIILQADQRRGVGVTCGGDTHVILQIIFVDDVLSNLAEDERLQLEARASEELVL